MDLTFQRTEAIYWGAAALLLVLFTATIAVQLFDKRMIAGESVWAKPLKFYLALALHFGTLALATSLLSLSYRTAPILFSVAVAAVISAGFEMTYMVVQAAHAQGSHFNLSTPFYAAMYALMAIGAVIITGAAGIVGVAAWLDAAARLTAALRTALTLGLVGGAVLTLIVAFRMGAALNHHVGFEGAGAARIPLTGWSRTVGDLRVPHFFATHMMQAVPIAGLMAERVDAGAAAVSLVWLFAAAWTALTAFTFSHALAGQPVLS